jgi:hypothetical protein
LFYLHSKDALGSFWLLIAEEYIFLSRISIDRYFSDADNIQGNLENIEDGESSAETSSNSLHGIQVYVYQCYSPTNRFGTDKSKKM